MIREEACFSRCLSQTHCVRSINVIASLAIVSLWLRLYRLPFRDIQSWKLDMLIHPVSHVKIAAKSKHCFGRGTDEW